MAVAATLWDHDQPNDRIATWVVGVCEIDMSTGKQFVCYLQLTADSTTAVPF